MAWKSVSACPNHVNVGGASRGAFFEDHRAHVDQRQEAALDNLPVVDFAPPDASVHSELFDEPDHVGIRPRLPAAILITVETATGLLAKPPHGCQSVGDHAIRVRASFPPEQLEARPGTDIVAAQVAYPLRPHGKTEILECRVNPCRCGSFHQQLLGLAKVAIQHHAIPDETEG